MKASAIALLPAPFAVLLGVVLLLGGTAGCTNGTTPVCNDAGSCLIAPPVGDGGAGQDSPAD